MLIGHPLMFGRQPSNVNPEVPCSTLGTSVTWILGGSALLWNGLAACIIAWPVEVSLWNVSVEGNME